MWLKVVVGAQWGDEGKGKITDFLAKDCDIAGKSTGGANAGHTVYVGDEEFVLHYIPSPVISNKNILALLGTGMVINLPWLLDEIQGLEKRGVDLNGRLFISRKAHLTLPSHILLEGDKERIGTTKKGIGPTYTDKASRFGIRVGDAQNEEKLSTAIYERLQFMAISIQEAQRVVREYLHAARVLMPFIADTERIVWSAMDAGKSIILEGAQGVLLDLDHGTYPFVTSSNPTAAGMLQASGIPPLAPDEIFGVTKAYTTRVGNGPFPTEMPDDVAQVWRNHGEEFGATTGRPRRCGWLDLVALKYAHRLNRFTGLVVTKLDKLSGLDEIPVCTKYRDGSTDIDTAIAEYEIYPGWSEDISGCKKLEELPRNARRYIDLIERHIGVGVKHVSVGKKSDQLICVD